MLKWISLAGFLLLAGCASADQQAREAAAQQRLDQNECERLGFTQGNDAFANCLLKLQEIRARQQNTAAIERANTPRPWGWGPWGRPWGHYGY